MSSFLDSYELANDTIKRFWVENPTGRIVPVIIDVDMVAGWILFKVDVYREYEDGVPSASSHAYGNVSFYPANMKRWIVEDVETSAIARAIKLLTPSAERPSREDMQKVETLPPVPEALDPWATSASSGIPTLGEAIATLGENLGAVATVPTPRCTHGARVWKTGEKNGRAWAGYMCQEANRANKCEPVWYEVDSAGKYKVQA
jgi:hypothetical protein